MSRVLVLGGRGMLGRAVTIELSALPDIDVVAPLRPDFEAGRDDVDALLDRTRPDYVINAIGVLASLIDEREPRSVERAIAVNARFPADLARAATTRAIRMIHASTDGVFSGRDGPYDESAVPDPIDVYGETKLRGEVTAEGVLNIRTSLIGPEERSDPRSLAGRIAALEHGARLTGWTDHTWNGVTTQAWARACAGLVQAPELPPSPLHLVPADVVNKNELAQLLANALGRDDVEVVASEAPARSNRTLATRHPEVERVWAAAGYGRAPTIAAMVREQFQ